MLQSIADSSQVPVSTVRHRIYSNDAPNENLRFPTTEDNSPIFVRQRFISPISAAIASAEELPSTRFLGQTFTNTLNNENRINIIEYQVKNIQGIVLEVNSIYEFQHTQSIKRTVTDDCEVIQQNQLLEIRIFYERGYVKVDVNSRIGNLI